MAKKKNVKDCHCNFFPGSSTYIRYKETTIIIISLVWYAPAHVKHVSDPPDNLYTLLTVQVPTDDRSGGPPGRGGVTSATFNESSRQRTGRS